MRGLASRDVEHPRGVAQLCQHGDRNEEHQHRGYPGQHLTGRLD